MDFIGKAIKYIKNFKKNRVLRKKMRISEENAQTFLDFSKTMFDVCENEFKDLKSKLSGTIKIIVPSEKQQPVFEVVLRDIMRAKVNIRAQLTSDLSKIYEALTKTNERNNQTVPVNGKGRPRKSKKSKSGPPPGNSNIEEPVVV